jgi:hypothetical protein
MDPAGKSTDLNFSCTYFWNIRIEKHYVEAYVLAVIRNWVVQPIFTCA